MTALAPAPPAGLTAHQLARCIDIPGFQGRPAAVRSLLRELVAAGIAAEPEPGCYCLSAEAEERFGPALRNLRSEAL